MAPTRPITTNTAFYCKPSRGKRYLHTVSRMLTPDEVAMVAFMHATSNEGPSTKRYCNTVSRKLRNYDTDKTDYDIDLLLLQAQ